jgi:nucleoside-diphosphate-sugar epimerase
MNILITGAGGFIGAHLYNHLENTHDVTRIFSSIQPAAKQKTFSVDLTKKNRVETLIQDLSSIRFDAILHLATKMASLDSIEKISILNKNIDMIENMVLLIKRLKPQLVIHFSSMAVYPNISGIFSEDSLPMPQKNRDCIYGLSKFASEIILDFSLRNEKMRIAHLRVAQVYGDGMRQDRIIPVMRKELEEKNSITVYGNGERQSCFIEIKKLVETVDYFLENNVDGVYNVGDENISYFSLAEKVIAQFGNNKSNIIQKSMGSKEKFNLDSSKLLETMNA